MSSLTVLNPVAPSSSIASDLLRIDVGEVRFGRHDRMLYSTDASLYQVAPIGVVVPGTAEQVGRLVSYCREMRIAMLPRGGGTSLAGQCTNGGIVVDLSPRFRRVWDVDIAGRRCKAEAGVVLDQLNRELAGVTSGTGRGLFFAPDPATAAQAVIGGCIGNNAAGARSVRYGRTSENIAGIDVMLASGERMWLGAGAGRRDPAAAKLAAKVVNIVAENAEVIRRRIPKLVRRNAGYGLDLIVHQLDAGVWVEDLDLSGLLCGSEGTLAITLAAELKLQPLPIARGLAIVSFDSIDAAIAQVPVILETGPSAVELLDRVVLNAAAGNLECNRYLAYLPQGNGTLPQAVLYVEYQAEETVEELAEKFDGLGRAIPGASTVVHRDVTALNAVWTLRKSAEALLHGMSATKKPVTFVEDNAVPVENLGRFVREFRQIVRGHGTEAAFYAHASVGVLHVRPMLDLREAEGLKKMQAIAVEVADLARECGGVMSGEHGDGRARGPLLERFYGQEMMHAFREVKRVFDPLNLLNPGNIVGAGAVDSITQNLRVQKENDPGRVETYFNYEDQEGFISAVETCNGAGFCRKNAGGTMCPSYRATLDERHSTRGRGNALRLAITGQAAPPSGRSLNGDSPASELTTQTPVLRYSEEPDLAPGISGSSEYLRTGVGNNAGVVAPVINGETTWEDADTIATLDLCLSCKACKTECPSNVDISRLKAEYTAQRFKRKGKPISARVFGHIRLLNQLGSISPGLGNWMLGTRAVRWTIRRGLGVAPQRRLPRLGSSLFRWFDARRGEGVAVDAPVVVLFGDCFTAYNEPEIGRSAVWVLERLGYRVVLPKTGCCGRAMISVGLLADAIAAADATLAALERFILDPNVVGIVVCEPSCLSAMKDDWLQLKLNTPMEIRQKLAAKAMLVEDFVERRWEAHPVKTAVVKENTDSICLHGHCHQKALWGDQTSSAILQRLSAGRVEVLPSGCCGMAGSFGYAAQKYELSMKIGELSVFPPIRATGKETIVVAPGTSCRHQIRDGTGREAVHPIQLVAKWLGEKQED